MLLQDTIGIYPNALSNELCDQVIKIYETALTKKLTRAGSTGMGAGVKDIKDSEDFNLLELNSLDQNVSNTCNILYDVFNTYIMKLLNDMPHQDKFPGNQNFTEPTTFEILQVQRYKKNQGHYNAWHHEHGTFKMSRRYFVLLAYLNDVQEGGETEMLYTGQKIKPEKGKLLLHPASFPYVHKGNMPLSEDKTILISWLSFVNNNR